MHIRWVATTLILLLQLVGGSSVGFLDQVRVRRQAAPECTGGVGGKTVLGCWQLHRACPCTLRQLDGRVGELPRDHA